MSDEQTIADDVLGATMKKDDGGPAFPHGETLTQGMTLRDWFAGQAMLAVLGAEKLPKTTYSESLETAARMAYDYADAMIAHREKKP